MKKKKNIPSVAAGLVMMTTQGTDLGQLKPASKLAQGSMVNPGRAQPNHRQSEDSKAKHNYLLLLAAWIFFFCHVALWQQ